jgi:hypothetical protein
MMKGQTCKLVQVPQILLYHAIPLVCWIYFMAHVLGMHFQKVCQYATINDKVCIGLSYAQVHSLLGTGTRTMTPICPMS